MRIKQQAIYVETTIHTTMNKLWQHTQQPQLHKEWDLRFSDIQPLAPDENGNQKFEYRTRIFFGLQITGTGASRGSYSESGANVSALAFASKHPLSLIRSGNGYWKYVPGGAAGQGIAFLTRFQYETRFGLAGKLFDVLFFRPFFGYATAWSFDALKLWLEKDIHPRILIQRSLIHYCCVLLLGLLWLFEGAVPKLLYPELMELGLMQSAGVSAQLAPPLVNVIGIGEIALALLLCRLHRHSGIYWLQMAVLLAMTGSGLAASPMLFTASFGPLTLSLAMLGLCAIAMMTAKDLPQAGRCKRKPGLPAGIQERGSG